MNSLLVMQTDFGNSDGAVSAMYGVALSVNKQLRIFDLTHDIPPFHIWDASYRLYQTLPYWPKHTVFVSVVDPGVGSDRKSVVVRTESDHFIVTPDNGTLTHIHKYFGIKEARIINEVVNRLPYSQDSYTFHGRDVYAYTAARLAAKQITYDEVGPLIPKDLLVFLSVKEPMIVGNQIFGSIDILDVRFGNLWTNIDRDIFNQLNAVFGNLFEVSIVQGEKQIYKSKMIFAKTFAENNIGNPLLYINSLNRIGIAINQGSFAATYQIKAGADWKVIIQPVAK
ncbi:S-adenosyl-l-methionine hydroxide adenosyltransferase family protein [Caldibacillus lycopersici]|uniref:S-adenosyl-l-methionine hydroxide adenosyltransferase family protein n=1 Tax=Perspicuibacillus lycopersici TaxID=1325689 RepID=A0AAE3LRU4_9BACI|nr:S-adenosyl-l-methionine hydroxide adenosyltransferase family protein [Perspicuibacillus lycopersici]MCU9615054.1 S-adenosyl-l-methionine hydroxide adenosyltransferase family protein [Perspicuibacillus lycopersici]